MAELDFPNHLPEVGTVVTVTWKRNEDNVSVVESPVVRRGIRKESGKITYEFILFWVEGEINRLTHDPASNAWAWGKAEVEVAWLN